MCQNSGLEDPAKVLPQPGKMAKLGHTMPTKFQIPVDPTSIARKRFAIAEHVPLVVLGAGPAGIAAAVEAAGLGLRTLLIDEHPIASALIGIDVPWMFGERMGAAVQNQGRMLEHIVAARPELQAAFDAGVDVRLGVYAWGAFVEGPTSKALPGPMLGLADESRAWFVGFDRLIVAAGGRDLGLAFPGWDRPGVMGARGFAAAVGLYGAFTGRRLVVLGAGAAGREVVRQAQAAEIEIAAVVDVTGRDGSLAGVPVHAGYRVTGVIGAEVEGVAIARPDGSGAMTITCDTIVLAVDVVPTVEMFDLLGCATRFDGGRGGWVPVIDAEGRCSRPGIYAAGDCAGVSDAALADPRLAEAAGRWAARAAGGDSGLAATATEPVAEHAGPDRDAWRREWLAAHAAADLPVCRCEEVALRDLVGVRPPRYLSYDETRFARRDLQTLAADGPLNQDQIKRLTRAGMGACQGRRCREQVQTLLAMQGNQATGSVPLPSYRAPLRPLPLAVLAAFDEAPELRAEWVTWFGIAAQWLPHWEPVPEGITFQPSLIPGAGK
jgi:thioredoxin reductase